MPWRIVSTPIQLHDIFLSNPTLDGIEDLQYAQGRVFAIRKVEGQNEREIIEVYNPDISRTRALPSPVRRIEIDIEDRIIGGKEVFGTAMTTRVPGDFDTSPNTFNAYLETVDTGSSNLVAVIAGVGLAVTLILTFGTGFLFTTAGGAGLIGYTATGSGSVALAFGSTAGFGTVAFTLPFNVPVLSGLIAASIWSFGPSAITVGTFSLLAVGGTAALGLATTAAAVAGAITFTESVGVVEGIQDALERIDVEYVQTTLPGRGTVQVDIAEAPNTWTISPSTISAATGNTTAQWFRTTFGIPPAGAGDRVAWDSARTILRSTVQRIDDAEKEINRLLPETVFNRARIARLRNQIAADKVLQESQSRTYAEEYQQIVGTRVYRNTGNIETLVRTFIGEAVSLTRHKDTYIAMVGVQMREVAIDGFGRDNLIEDFTERYRNAGLYRRGVIFKGAPSICSDGDRYIYILGTDTVGSDEVNSLWRIHITDLEIAEVDDITVNVDQRILINLPRAASGTGKAPFRYDLLSPLPDGLVYNSTSRQITGRVRRTVADGEYLVQYRCRDANDAFVTSRFTITVKSEPFIEEFSLGHNGVGVEIPAVVLPIVRNGPADVTYFYRLDNKLSEMPTLERDRMSGALTIPAWTPSAALAGRRFRLSLFARPTPRSTGGVVHEILERDIDISFFQPNRPPIIPDNLPTVLGTQFQPIGVFDPMVTDPDGDSITYTSFGAPGWVVLDEDRGLISGVPNVGGLQTMQLICTDDGVPRERSQATVRFQITPVATDVPVLPGLDDRTDAKDRLILEFQIPEVGNAPINQTYDYSVSNLPTGLSFNPSTRIVSGTPTVEGTSTVTYQAERTSGTVGAATLQNSYEHTIVAQNTLNQPDIRYRANTAIRDVALARVVRRDESVTYEYHVEGLPEPLEYFEDGHRLFPGSRGAVFERENSVGFDCTLVATPSSKLFAVLKSKFKIFVDPRATGRLVQNDLIFFQNRTYQFQPFARVQDGPPGSNYEYRISGTAPTGMRMIARGIDGTPTVVQAVDVTLHAVATTGSGNTPDPNSPYRAEFTIAIQEDPDITGITLGCRGPLPVGFDSEGRPIYEFFVGEKPQLFWVARNLSLRDNQGYRVSVGGGQSTRTSDDDGTYLRIGVGFIAHRSEIFNNLTSNFRQATNPFKDLTYFEPLGAKSNRVSSNSVYEVLPERKSFTGRFFHSAGSRVLTLQYYDYEQQNIEPLLTTGRSYPSIPFINRVTGRATTPTRPTEQIYRATLQSIPSATDYSGITFVTRSTDSEGDVVPPGRITGVYRARRGGTDATPPADKTHEIRIRWKPQVLRWEDGLDELEYLINGGESANTIIGVLPGATGGTLPYKYSLHGRPLPGMTTTPYMRTYAQLDKSQRRQYLTHETSPNPPSFFGAITNGWSAYTGIYMMCEDSSPDPQIIWRLVKIRLQPT